MKSIAKVNFKACFNRRIRVSRISVFLNCNLNNTIILARELPCL